MNKTKSISIIGGGIGGLTLAVALQRKGFSVTVYEHAPQIKPLGAGLALAANAVKALAEIGISNEVIGAGKVIRKMAIKDPQGRVLNETDSEKISRQFGVINNFTIHRADLHQVLLSFLQEGTVQLGKACINFHQTETGVTINFSDGSSTTTDCVVACDGIHSVFRTKFLPESKPRYAGYTCWRGVIDDLPDGFDPEETSETWGPGCRFGIAPISNNRVYWFACINAKENDEMMRSFTKRDLLTYFGDFHFPVPEILKQTKEAQLIWSDIIDLKPIDQFAFGNIVLMGDAAHATTPNMGQGACMAIEDAATLSNCLVKYPTIYEAFKHFEQKRIKRTTKIVNGSWSLGKVAQLQNPFLGKLRNAAIRITPSSVAINQLKFLYDISFD